jgi:hypothetical protein
VGTELTFQHLEQGFLIRWGLRCRPPVVLTELQYRDVLVVNDSQRFPVLGSFVTVTLRQRADGVDAAELLSQLLQTGPGDDDPPPGAGSDEIPRSSKGFQRLIHRAAGQP